MTVDLRPFEPADAAHVARLAGRVGWPSLTDPELVRRICTSPGATSYSAVAGDRVVGWAQALGDGVLQSHLSFLVVDPDHRRHGIGRLLVMATFQATGTKRMDLITEAGEGFYARFAHHAMHGYRLYPGADDPLLGDGR
ncbi:GNAT family N-acetyltransferase [Nocardioides sambongensis]|uniref:GNAT family N-acetyltransferase n=1 Tax=Nocardioides sambongensis TaxID=2589074 RepID=UPI0015E85A1E|nr:GNAT family N-acetyltransferase [Nocardioides sambongensis]